MPEDPELGPIEVPEPEPEPLPVVPLNCWFEVAINGGSGFMLLTDGTFWGYYDKAGVGIKPNPGTTIYVTKNDVKGPF